MPRPQFYLDHGQLGSKADYRRSGRRLWGQFPVGREYMRYVSFAKCNSTSADFRFSCEQLLSPEVDRFCRTSILSLYMQLPGMLPVHLRL